MIIVIYFYFPEVCYSILESRIAGYLQTKQRPLEDIGELFGDPPHVVHMDERRAE